MWCNPDVLRQGLFFGSYVPKKFIFAALPQCPPTLPGSEGGN